MRYAKGSIQLSASHDHPLLRQVLRCGFVTHDQLFAFLRRDCNERNRQSFDWRARRLVKHGLIVRQTAAMVNPASCTPWSLMTFSSVCSGPGSEQDGRRPARFALRMG
jgi:hypothetical protein